MQDSIVLRAENIVSMECSLRRLASGRSASANHLNQTASRWYRCDGDLDGMASLPNDSVMGWMAINRGEACSSSHRQPPTGPMDTSGLWPSAWARKPEAKVMDSDRSVSPISSLTNSLAALLPFEIGSSLQTMQLTQLTEKALARSGRPIARYHGLLAVHTNGGSNACSEY